MEIAELKGKQGNVEIERNNYSTVAEMNYLAECCSREIEESSNHKIL